MYVMFIFWEAGGLPTENKHMCISFSLFPPSYRKVGKIPKEFYLA